MTPSQVLSALLPDRIFRLPQAGSPVYVTREQYLSGDVGQKLSIAQRWAQLNPDFAVNVTALIAAQPKPLPPEQIQVSFGASFVPAAAYRAFVNHLLPSLTENWKVDISFAEATSTWTIDFRSRPTEAANTTTWGTPRCLATELIEAGLRLETPTVYDTGPDGERVKDSVATAAATAKLADIREEWQRWWRGSGFATQIAEAYAERFNQHVPRRYDGSHLTFAGLAARLPSDPSQPLTPRRHQLAGALRIVERGDLDDTVLLTYKVGLGKSLSAILGVKKRFDLGLSRKAVFVVPKHTLSQWRDFWRDYFPAFADRVLVADDGDFTVKTRQDFLATACLPSSSVVVLTYEQMATIPLKPDTFRAYIEREIDEVHADLLNNHTDTGSQSPLKRELKRRQARLEKLRAKYQEKWQKLSEKGTAPISWEDVGADVLVCDECFPGDTKVITEDGPLAIRDIVNNPRKIRVLSRKGTALEWRYVVRGISRPLSRQLVRVEHTYGSFICTSNHKIATQAGYKAAENLSLTDTLFYNDETNDLPTLSTSVPIPSNDATTCMYGQPATCKHDHADLCSVWPVFPTCDGRQGCNCQAQVLQYTLFCALAEPNSELEGSSGCSMQSSSTQVRHKKSPSSTEDENQQSYVDAWHCGKSPSQTYWSNLPSPGRQLQTHKTSADFSGGFGLADGASDTCVGCATPIYIATTHLQSRFSAHRFEDRCGGGRQIAQDKKMEISRQEKNSSLKCARVVRVTFLERRGVDQFTDSSSEDTRVYDLEVEGNHNYFAEGILVSNCHLLKNDTVTTRMSNVSGMPRSESQRAFDARMKSHWVAAPELFGELGVQAALQQYGSSKYHTNGYPPSGKLVGLTGTPITNTLAEVWVMMRLFQPRLLRDRGLHTFDAFAAVFTTPMPTVEMDAVGKFRQATRLRWQNLPELQMLLSQCWDRASNPPEIVRPDLATGRMRIVEVEGSSALRAYVAELAERAERVRAKEVDPSIDNMLKITHDGRIAGLFNGPPPGPNEPWPTHRTKVDAAAEVIAKLYTQSAHRRGVVLVFCDLFTPKADSDTDTDAMTDAERFRALGVYGVLRDKLIAQGVHAEEVAFVHDAETQAQRDKLFQRTRAGDIRVLIGSTQKLATGVNVQDRVYGMIHLTVPWRPDWLEQADGRGRRQGNKWAIWGEGIHSIAVVTTGSYDVVSWQMIEQKATFISAIVNDEYEGRTADDIGDLVVTANVAKAIALGDMRVIEKTQLEVELTQHQRRYRLWREEKRRRADMARKLPGDIADLEAQVGTLQAMVRLRDGHMSAQSSPGIILLDNDRTIHPSTRDEANQRVFVLAERLRNRSRGEVELGTYRGLNLMLSFGSAGVEVVAQYPTVEQMPSYASVADIVVKVVADVFGAIDYQLGALDNEIAAWQQQAQQLRDRLAEVSSDMEPWQGDTARAALARYEALCTELADGGPVDRKSFDLGALWV